MPTAKEIRQQFIDYFVEKHGHTFVPSSSVIPHGDPSLNFTNAGMNQFKDVFLGQGSRPYSRAVNSQKCIRVSGKHNDLEEVGRDTYHHTFFEMLGNWSFGDYYKAEAIEWAWTLLTEVWGIEKDRLHATIFGGDKELGLEADTEAEELWKKVTDIPEGHILHCGKKDNFWTMGDTGPCGPCSEIHIDLTENKSGGSLVNKDDPRVVEIWNLVFIQYNQSEDGKLTTLPSKHVDTGMGFERVVAALQGKKSNYDTDIFTPLLTAIEQLSGLKYGRKMDDSKDIAFRVIADHVRMASFAIADGAMPDNQGSGSSLRSVLRRSVRFCYQQFEQREPFVYKLVPTLVTEMGDAFPELKEKQTFIEKTIRTEEEDFYRTIARGLSLFEETAKKAKSKKGVISGDDAFELATTHGFPLDLMRQMAEEKKLSIDEKQYEKRWDDHRKVSGGKKASQLVLNVSGGLPATDDRLRWSSLTGEGKVLGWILEQDFVTDGKLVAIDQPTEGEEPPMQAGLILDKTSFYAEAGGQVGDSGLIKQESGAFRVLDSIRQGDAVVHLGYVESGMIEAGEPAKTVVDQRREDIRRNHTATHLAHWALQKILGDHVEQRGSKVKAENFTFDFAHDKPLTPEEKLEVERLVNEKAFSALPVEWQEMPTEEARNLPGVRAFFGDKYGDTVRVVTVGDGFSQEFCGGTHLDNTGQVGLFRLVGEELVSKGIRRITGVTGPEALKQTQAERQWLTDAAGTLRCTPQDLPERIASLQQELKKLDKQLKSGAVADLQGEADKLFQRAKELNGAKVIVGELPAAPTEAMRAQADRLRQKAGTAAIVLGWKDPEEEKVSLLAAVTDDLVKQGLHAGKLVGKVAQEVGGKGGGRPQLAQAGGKDPANLPKALELAMQLITESLDQ
ncbi:Alanine--tRNA ligase [Planctomycetales bacterium 10988]|nr:Alanine--tRNA ligase [Planctomycetales bacterium 10988]